MKWVKRCFHSAMIAFGNFVVENSVFKKRAIDQVTAFHYYYRIIILFSFFIFTFKGFYKGFLWPFPDEFSTDCPITVAPTPMPTTAKPPPPPTPTPTMMANCCTVAPEKHQSNDVEVFNSAPSQSTPDINIQIHNILSFSEDSVENSKDGKITIKTKTKKPNTEADEE